MKKIIAIVLLITGVASAQSYIAESVRITNDTVTATNGNITVYTGMIKVYLDKPSPTETNAQWAIIRTRYNAAGQFVSMDNAYKTNGTQSALWQNIWTNRYNATYK
jgi:hypothetical protein